MTSFLKSQSLVSRQKYQKNLQVCASLSGLFSTSKVPYLHYRISERIFCKSFDADDLSRSDIAVDVSKEAVGLGIKTFLAKPNNHTLEKVAEFNADRKIYNDLNAEEKIRTISILRNDRIRFAQNCHGLGNCLYHCVVRRDGFFDLCEEEMPLINLDKIKKVKDTGPSIKFQDDQNEYNFNLSKSTLFKRFWTNKPAIRVPVEIMADPLSLLDSILQESGSKYGRRREQLSTNFEAIAEQADIVLQLEEPEFERAYLPLYGNGKKVYDKSGLNQWNASGRKRGSDEVYIPVPIKFHRKCEGFFPPRDTKFELLLPGRKKVSAKICSQNSKALYSDPNEELGKWILRDVLRLQDGELLTIDRLYHLGIDSVRIDKLENGVYEMNFAAVNSYEDFINE
jgi:hypothetical protein